MDGLPQKLIVHQYPLCSLGYWGGGAVARLSHRKFTVQGCEIWIEDVPETSLFYRQTELCPFGVVLWVLMQGLPSVFTVVCVLQ